MAKDGAKESSSGREEPALERLPSVYQPRRRFHLTGQNKKQYQQQYGDIYFFRLAKLKPVVEKLAEEAWEDFEVAGEVAQKKSRVLDVRQGELCWVTGTIYMDMPLKPNVLEDIAADQGVAVPPPREKYLSPSGKDQVMLEDESGRVLLVGAVLQEAMLVTGCVVAVIGSENSTGEFEVFDLKIPDLPPQPARWAGDDSKSSVAANCNGSDVTMTDAGASKSSMGGLVAIVSGLGISGAAADGLTLDLLQEFLLGEAGGPDDQRKVSRISRLIVAGGLLARTPKPSKEATGKKVKKYGYDASAYNPAPTAHLDRFLGALLPSIPVTIFPGETDPANVSIPQQPLHTALFPRGRAYANHPHSKEAGWFDTTTNPWEGNIDGWKFMGNGGQPISDIFKYVDGNDRLHMMESVLRWRIQAPTAPDTLCRLHRADWQAKPLANRDAGCYPYQDEEPFIIEEAPHVFFVGNQPKFGTTTTSGPSGQEVRLIAVPKFKETGQV